MINISKISRNFFIGCLVQLMPLLPLAAIWAPPVRVSVPTPVGINNSFGGVLDTNDLNNGVAVWGAPRGFLTDIQTSFYTFGVGWSEPVIISSLALLPINGNRIFIAQGDPCISMNNFNYCVATWEGSEYLPDVGENIQAIYAAERNPNGTWTPVQRINPINLDPLFFETNATCAVSDSGLAVAAWREQRRDNGVDPIDYVMASILQQGGSWSTPVELVNAGPASVFNRDRTPSAAVDAKGNIIVAYHYVGGDGLVTAVSTYSVATNTWAPSHILTTGNFDGTLEDLPKVAINPNNGNGIVVWNWKDLSGDIQFVYSASYTNGVWGPPVVVSSLLLPGDDLNSANVIMDGMGNATAIWNLDSISTQVLSSSLPFGGTWSQPVVISPVPSGNNAIDILFVERPISVNVNGDVMVIYRNDFSAAYTVTKPFGQPWLTPELVTSETAYPDQLAPRLLNVGIGTCGVALSLWEAGIVSENPFGVWQLWSSVHSSDTLVTPCNFTGTQCREKMATQSTCVNTLTWENCDQCALSYKLYKNGVQIATIPPQGPFVFVEPVRCGVTNTYCLTAVNVFGVEGPASCVVLP